MDSATEQCTAKSKRSGERCKRLVIGGGPCHMHGGAAPQVRARREQRVFLAEARAAAPTVIVQQEPEEILIGALHDANTTLQAIKAELKELNAGSVNPAVLPLVGDWLDRVSRIGKVVVDGELAERLEKRIGWMAQDRAAQLTALLAAIVEAASLTAQQKLAVWESRFDGLQSVADGRAPSRMLGDATVRYTDTLQIAAAAERAVADGITWGDSEFDSDSGDGGSPLLFPGNGSGVTTR